MTELEEKWLARVREYRASGQAMTAFCQGKDYTANSLGTWARRFPRPGRPPKTTGAGPAVPMARVVAASTPCEGVTVERDGVRVYVGAGSDRELVADVFEMLWGRG